MRALWLLAAGLLAPPGSTTDLIDRRISERWADADVRPARRADDYEFLRRLSLDLRGVIPDPGEIRFFVADSDRGKREKIVDAWLRSKDFAGYWAKRWSDDLILQPLLKKKYGGIHASLEGWLRDAIRANVPYDRFVRRLLTAKGPTDLDPAAGFLAAGLVNKNDGAKEVVERASRLFLGMRIRCAECHDHPFDDWTQQDFYGMASFFWRSRSEVRGGPKAGGGPLRGWVRDDLPVGDPRPPGGLESYPPKYKGTDGSPGEDEPRRIAFARFLIRDRQFARAAVNRHWAMLIGRGLMHPADGFSVTRKPSHPKLLEELTRDFVASKYDVRRLMKSILLSTPYQLSSKWEGNDSEGTRFFARALTVPMSRSQLVESIVRATGIQRPIGLTSTVSKKGTQAFAVPSEEPGTIQRALFFLNGVVTSRGSSADAGLRLGALLARERDPAKTIEELFLATVSRPPTRRESAVLEARLRETGGSAEAYEDILWALLNSTEFVTRH